MLAGLAGLADHHMNCPFAGRAHHVQLEGVTGSGLERAGHVVDRGYRPARADTIRSPMCEAGACGRAALPHLANEQALGVGEAVAA